uniref:Zgc:195282 n=1 Tax=Paramormyrops kingsleyae TaxID=1676925 RepID=A0A3B3SUJ8_9TELE
MVGYCPICGKPVYFGEKKRSLGRDYHPLCLKCQECKRQLNPGQHAEVRRHRATQDPELPLGGAVFAQHFSVYSLCICFCCNPPCW